MLDSIHFNQLEVQLGIWGGLILVTTTIVGLLSSFFVMLWFFIASLCCSVIGFVSVLAIVILISPNHSTSSSVIPKNVIAFQHKIKVILYLDSI